MPRRSRRNGNRAQNNANIPQPTSLNDQSYPGPQPGPIYSDRADQIRQVDAWRSYRNDGLNLQSSITPQSYQPLSSPNTNVASSSQSSLNIHAPAFTSYQPLRVSNGTRERQVLRQALQAPQITGLRYPPRDRQLEQITTDTIGVADNLPRFPEQPAPSNRYENYGPSFLSADQPVPSIETGFLPLGHSSTLVPSSLPPRFADRRSYSRTPDNVRPPTRPTVMVKYLKSAREAPSTIDSPKKLLVILDLNGTLLVRPDGRRDPTSFKLRPGVTHLLDYLFENHVVMVYSSARPENVNAMVNKLIPPKQRAQMAAIWARDKLDLNKAQYDTKVQVYKKLDKIWADPTIQASAEAGQKWNQSNTVLVDDSHLKALAQPHNLVQVPEFENNAPRQGGEALRAWQLQEMAILKSLEQKLEALKWQVDVSRLIREWQTGKRQAPGVVDETIDQKTHEIIQEQLPRGTNSTPSLINAESESTSRPPELNYPSPKSPRASSSMDQRSKIAMGSSALDILEAEIEQGLRNSRLSESNDRRSESPIEESVFKDLLGGEVKGTLGGKEPASGSSIDVPRTPESMGR